MPSRRLFIQVLASFLSLLGFSHLMAAESLHVASLHPLITDLAKQVGGSQVRVTSLLPPGADPHQFDPTSRDLQRIQNARLILASGKHLESYLPKLKQNLPPNQEIFEVGKNVPSILVDPKNDHYRCCAEHEHGSIDPHWWHSVQNMKRAARLLADEFARVDPSHAQVYRDNAQAWTKKLDELKKWADQEIRKIPRKERKIVTAHAAFGYFCKEFNFDFIPVQGITREVEPSSEALAQTIATIKTQNIQALFPEALADRKILNAISSQTGVKLGEPLIADGTGLSSNTDSTYEAMLRHNVTVIVQALNRTTP